MINHYEGFYKLKSCPYEFLYYLWAYKIASSHSTIELTSLYSCLSTNRMKVWKIFKIKWKHCKIEIKVISIRLAIRLNPFVLTLLHPGISRCLLPKNIEDESTVDKPGTVCLSSAAAAVPPPASPIPSVSERGRADSISQITRSNLNRRDSVLSTQSNVSNYCAQNDKDLINLKSRVQSQRKRLKYYAALTPQPYFVYEHYDETVLVEKVHRLLKTELRGLTESRGKIPVDASDLSFWLAQNLTMDDSHRTKVLQLDSPIQRLRYELELLARTVRNATELKLSCFKFRFYYLNV